MNGFKKVIIILVLQIIALSSFSQIANEYYKGIWRGFGYFTDDYNLGNWDNDDYANLQTVIEPVEDSILQLKTNNNRYNYGYLKTIKGDEYLILELKKHLARTHYQAYKITRTGDNQFEAHLLINYTKKMKIFTLNDMYYYIFNNGKNEKVYAKKPNLLKRVSTVNQFDCVDCYH